MEDGEKDGVNVNMRSRFELNATMVANEFIDHYMAAANGEYVKVYLYLLRCQEKKVTVTEIADALDHTESDVRRALAYWTRLGVLNGQMEEVNPTSESVVQDDELTKAAAVCQSSAETAIAGQNLIMEESAAKDMPKGKENDEIYPASRDTGQRPVYTPEQISRLAKEEEFTQLLYISQKYMNKVFTPRECEVFAYLYDSLRMSAELLEYLVEYCVQENHYSIRYLETVALNWHERGICTVDMAKQHTETFSNDAFAVMKAFGLNDRRPGDSEMAAIRRWVKEWSFSREMILEACSRTLKAIHNPSFSYADKILSEWRKAGARTLSEVRKLDEKRENREKAGRENRKAPATVPVTRIAKNQFHNFEQRDTDYDEMVMTRLKERLGER